jgi:hypothetical protein
MTPREVVEVGADDEIDVLEAHPIDALMKRRNQLDELDRRRFNEGWHIRWRRNDKWRTPKGPVENRDLWERLLALVEDDARTVSFVGLRDMAMKRTTTSSIASPERLRNRMLRTEPPLSSSHQWNP